MTLKSLLRRLIIVTALVFSLPTFALDQYVKQWLAINSLQRWNNQWRTFIYAQLRLVDNNHPWQAGLVEGGLGHQFTSESSAWVGYRWTGLNFFNNFTQENRFFQQMISQKKLTRFSYFVIRSRLEEITRGNSNQVALRLRERFGLEINHELFQHAFPFLYNEFFLQLNHPNYMPRTFWGENRLFIGFNLYRSKKTWWEIGYMNQYQIKTPQQTQNQMSHILSITDNFW